VIGKTTLKMDTVWNNDLMEANLRANTLMGKNKEKEDLFGQITHSFREIFSIIRFMAKDFILGVNFGF
jgi:hypothetical protein